MSTAAPIEDFIPHYEPISQDDFTAALDDLNPRQTTLGVSIPLPYTRREDGTVDTIDAVPSLGGVNWMVYTGRDYHGDGHTNVTAQVAACPGHMVILVVRALHAHLSAVGTRGRQGTVEGDVLYALGIVRPAEEVRP
jgi:hypothetical protein